MNPILLSGIAQALPEILRFGMEVYLRLPDLIAAGQDVSGILQATGEAVKLMVKEERGPSPEEWSAMNEMIATMRAQFHAPDA